MKTEIKTSMDAWDEVHRLHDCDYTPQEIATETGLSLNVVNSYYLRNPRPTRKRAINRNHMSATRCACGTAIPRDNESGHCFHCRQAVNDSININRLIEIRTLATSLGRVPRVGEIATYLGVGRSVAGELRLVMFGRDDRTGGDRREDQPLRGFRPVWEALESLYEIRRQARKRKHSTAE
jgi:hypothetical protein